MGRSIVGRSPSAHSLDRRLFCATLGLSALLGGNLFPSRAAVAQTNPRFDLAAHPEFEAIIEGAKKEGALLALSNFIYEGVATLPALFKQYYNLPSSYKFEFVNKGGAQITKQIQEELSADRVTADVVLFNVLASAKSLASSGELLEFEAPEYSSYAHLDKLGFNNRRFYVSDIYILGNLVWNSDIIKRDFKAWADVINADMNGRISFVNARLSSSMALTYKSMREEPSIGDRFFRELAKLKPTSFQRLSQCQELVASGELPMTLIGANRAYVMKKDLGVNVRQSFPSEGVVPLAAPAFALRRTRYPNGAKLLLNFLRSPVAQAHLAALEGYTSGRADLAGDGSEFVPVVSRLKLLPVDVDLPEAELLTLGRDWDAIFGS